MSGPTFRFSKEISKFLGENQENLEFLSPDQGALDQSGLEWSAQGGGTQFARTADGKVEVALITSLDDDGKPETGQVQLKDVFTVHPNGEVDYQRISRPNEAAADIEAWQKKAQLFGAPPNKPEVLARIKQFIAEQVAPRFSEGYSKEFLVEFQSLPENQRKILEGLITLVQPMELDLKHPDSFYWVTRSEGKIALTLQIAVKEGEKLKGWVTNIFQLAPQDLKLVDFHRDFYILTKQGLKVQSEPASEASKALAGDFLEGMKPFFTESEGALAPDRIQEKSETAKRPAPKRGASPRLPVVKKIAEAGAAAEPLQPDLALMEAAMGERIDQEADASRGWWHRLSGGKPMDAAKEKDLTHRVLEATQEKLGQEKDPGKTILRTMADLPLSGEEKRVRDTMLKDYVVRQISNIAQTSDLEIRSHLYINLLRKDLMGAQHRPATAHYLAYMLWEALPMDSKTKDELMFIRTELDPMPRGPRDTVTTLELGMPRFLDGMTEPAMLAAFAAGGLGGATVEAAAFKGLKGIPALAGTGRIAGTVRNVLGVGTGISGEAAIFSGAHGVLNSFHHDASQMLSWDRFKIEWAQMVLLFGATRIAHGMTGAVARGLQGTKKPWVQKIFHKTGAGADVQIPIGPMGRYPTLEPLPKLNWFGELTTGALHHFTGIYTMQEVMNLYPNMKLVPEGEAHRTATFMDASLMYGHALMGFNLANAAARGKLQQTITQLKIGARLPQEVGPGDGALPSRPPEALDPQAAESSLDISQAPDAHPSRNSTIRGPGDPADPKQVHPSAFSTQPPVASKYPDGISGLAPSSVATGLGEGSRAMFPAAGQGSDSPMRSSVSLMAADGKSLEEISQAVLRGEIAGTPRDESGAPPARSRAEEDATSVFQLDPRLSRRSDHPGTEQPASAVLVSPTVEVAPAPGAVKRDSRPDILPSVEGLAPLQSEVISQVRGQELGWFQAQVDRFIFGGLYSRLVSEAPKILEAQRLAVHQAKVLYQAALPWFGRAESKAQELRETKEKLQEAQTKNQGLQVELGGKNAELSENAEMIRKLNADIAGLQRDVANAEAKFAAEHKKFEGMGDEWNATRDRVKSYERTTNVLKEQIEVQRELMEELRGIVTRLKKAVKSGGEDSSVSNLRLKEVLDKLASITNRGRDSEERVARALLEKTREYDGALEDLTRLRSQLRQAEEDKETAHDAKKAAETGHRQADDKLLAIRTRLEEILPEEEIPEDMTPAIERLVERAQKDLTLIRDAQAMIERIRAEREALEQKYSELEETMRKAGAASVEEVAGRDRTIKAHERARALKDRELDTVSGAKRAAEADAQAQRALVEQKAEEIAELEAAKAAAEARQVELETAMGQLATRFASLEVQLAREGNEKSAEIRVIRNNLDQANRDLEAARKELGTRAVAIQDLTADNHTLLKKIEGLREEITSLEVRLSQVATDVSPEILQYNRGLLKTLPYEVKTSEENPSSLDPSGLTRPVSVAVVGLTPEGKIDGVSQKALILPLNKEATKPFKDPKREASVVLIQSAEGLLWHSSVDHLNGRQKAAVADLAKGMEERQMQDPYTAAARLGEGVGQLARDLYHALKDSRRMLEDHQSTRLQIVKQSNVYRAFHISPDSAGYTEFRNHLRDHSFKIGIASIKVENLQVGDSVPFEHMVVTLTLGELAHAEPIRQVFLKMGTVLADRVTVNFEDGPSGPSTPAGTSGPGPSPSGATSERHKARPGRKVTVPKAPAAPKVEAAKPREEPAELDLAVAESDIEDISPLPLPPRTPGELSVGRATTEGSRGRLSPPPAEAQGPEARPKIPSIRAIQAGRVTPAPRPPSPPPPPPRRKTPTMGFPSVMPPAPVPGQRPPSVPPPPRPGSPLPRLPSPPPPPRSGTLPGPALEQAGSHSGPSSTYTEFASPGATPPPPPQRSLAPAVPPPPPPEALRRSSPPPSPSLPAIPPPPSPRGGTGRSLPPPLPRPSAPASADRVTVPERPGARVGQWPPVSPGLRMTPPPPPPSATRVKPGAGGTLQPRPLQAPKPPTGNTDAMAPMSLSDLASLPPARPGEHPAQAKPASLEPPPVDAFGAKPPSFDKTSGVLNWGHYAKRLVIGQTGMFKETGLISSETADHWRLDLNKGFRVTDYATLSRDGFQDGWLKLTNNQKKNVIYIKGGNLSSPVTVAPGETKRVDKGQTIVIGSYELQIEVP